MSGGRSARLDLEYDGAHFRGWARQQGYPTIEQSLLKALHARDVEVDRLVCAGRTDAGVHATGQVVSLQYRSPIEPERLAAALAKVLPRTISVVRSTPAPPDWDAREAALSRAYEYRVLTRSARAPLRAARTLHHPRALDLQALARVAEVVLGKHDFTAFTPAETEHVFFRRTVLESRWEQRGDELVFCVRANAFLRHMVRVMVGSMLAVGRGDWTHDRFVALLDGGSRSDAHQTAAPHALTLVDVEYSDDAP